MRFFSSTLVTLYALSAGALAMPTLDGASLATREQLDGTDASLVITTFNVPGCPGTGSQQPVTYGDRYTLPVVSYNVSRPLVMGEQLDFSDYAPGVAPYSPDVNGVASGCTLFLETTNPDSNNHMLTNNVCYELTNNATAQCFRFWKH
ncbi:hypothetical protein MMC28_004992 [Mycoblastus sanguinarius]|nr:hypothetical protein [Mycoblastus sanguinarius]